MSVKALKNSEVDGADGNIFGDYLLAEMLGSGSYSQVFAAQQQSTGESVAIKIALPLADTNSVAETGCFLSRALVQMTGSFGDAFIEPKQLLLRQYHDWLNVRFEGWPSVRETLVVKDVTAVAMDRVYGTSLRRLIMSGEANLGHAVALARTLVNMEMYAPELRHGDLKPENIMFSLDGSKAFLLDPGFFGPVSAEGQPAIDVSMTTPNYYPFLKADDMFAFGVILLELLSQRHPLTRLEGEQTNSEGLSVGESLRAHLSRARASFNYFPAGLYGLPLFLAENADCFTHRTIEIALRCMSLAVLDNAQIEIGAPYANFSELLSDLQI